MYFDLSFEDAKRTLRTWTSAAARSLLAGIEKLEALVEELRTGLQTVRRERNEAQQAIEVTLIDRKGFERKLTMPRHMAGPQILVPGPSGERISFRFQYGNLYREMW